MPSQRRVTTQFLFLVLAILGMIGRHYTAALSPQEKDETNNSNREKKETYVTMKQEEIIQQLTQGESGLVWHDLSVWQKEHPLLHSCTGFVPNGHVCGILGPSGAGKSTLIHALAGSSSSSSSSQGNVWQYHHPEEVLIRMTPPQVAWLQQHDSFFELLTVQETLQLAAFLELPHWEVEQRDALVQTKLQALGLAAVADRKVGGYHGSYSPKLSGGERRRLAVALELLTDKELLLADEPTTGLDTSMSVRVVQLIRDTVQNLQIPAFCVLHQPRSTIWNELLDDIILLASGGHVCYVGPRSEVRAYFDDLGYSCPQDTNPAEFYVDLISVDPEDPVQAALDEKRIQRIVLHFRKHQQEQLRIPQKNNQKHRDLRYPHNSMKEVYKIPTAQSLQSASRSHRPGLFHCPPWFLRFMALLKRSLRQNLRDTTSIVARLVFAASNAWLLTQLYPTVVANSPPTAHSLADRAALLTTAAIVVCNMAYMKTADLFEKEYPVVLREQMRHQYSTLEYLLAKALAELPLDALFAGVFSTVLKACTGLCIGWWPLTGAFSLLTAAGASLGFLFGSWFAAEGLAIQAGLPILVVLMLVGVINPSGVDPRRSPPMVTQLMKRISPFAYAIHAVMVAEFQDMQFVSSTGGRRWWSSIWKDLPRMGAMAMVRNGNQVLEALGLKQETYVHAMKHLAYLTGIHLLLSWWGLAVRRRKPSSGPKPSSKTIELSVSQGTNAAMPPKVARRVRL
ncbi:hypothetical protein FisN_13Lh355 [Fistulifera solaris]|uniref:ABC transporter domain-containing protein n=1 Tax=Fistulifera solaris TaxID=1519565 RepID=A0A1Z5KM44_FISSO|nr:hypothetical protein FisN_13Lh355 [Fistulifera solaris]|eukprot:GAX27101.1 hypothetical protein FisN_13Lh355 [Fistulifera solaris]